MDGKATLLLESYGARLARQGLAESTRVKYCAAVARFLASLGETDPATVSRPDVDDYLDRWHAAEQPAANSVRLHLSALKSFYGYLDDRGLLEGRNPVERIKAPRVRRRPNDRLRADEDAALLEACVSEQEKVLIWLLRALLTPEDAGHEGRTDKGTAVREILSSPLIVVTPQTTVDECMALMTDRRIRHVPVLDGGEVVGIVSIGHVVKFKSKQQSFEIKFLHDYIGAS